MADENTVVTIVLPLKDCYIREDIEDSINTYLVCKACDRGGPNYVNHDAGCPVHEAESQG